MRSAAGLRECSIDRRLEGREGLGAIERFAVDQKIRRSTHAGVLAILLVGLNRARVLALIQALVEPCAVETETAGQHLQIGLL